MGTLLARTHAHTVPEAMVLTPSYISRDEYTLVHSQMWFLGSHTETVTASGSCCELTPHG